MKRFSTTAIFIAVLALGLMHGLTYAVPDHPLGDGETRVLVGACAILVLSAKWIAQRLGHHEVSP